MIVNVHSRRLDAEPAEVGRVLESLASQEDRLWPREAWPPMRLDRPLAVGARGGHGPIRYRVVEHLPGERVAFAFDPRIGLSGTHALEAVPARGGGTLLRHVLEARSMGRMRLGWPLAFRWLHDALIEDALDRAAVAVGSEPRRTARWSPWVRVLRRLLAR